MNAAGRRSRGERRFIGAVWMVLAVVLVGLPRVARAQDVSARIRAQRDSLERIRREREELERRAAELATSIHDLNEEVTNLDRRRAATAAIVKGLDTQLATIAGEVDSANARLTATETELSTKRTALRKRLVDIYKRGPMQTTEALLSARSFGELVARYKYLHLLALHDRALVRRVEDLRAQVQADQARLVTLRTALEESRRDKAHEEEELRLLERDRSTNLNRTRAQVRVVENRISKLKETEEKMNSTIAALDADRRRAESSRPAATRAGSSIKTSDYGKLDWPVEGALIYSFGKAQTASNTTIRWNGVGIRGTVNEPVHTVAAGKVVNVGPLGTYGLTVIIDHGGGDYSIYGSLSQSDVRAGQTVAKGQVIGGVGISDPDLPPHLHFEIRHAGADGRPASVDPATWLRGQR